MHARYCAKWMYVRRGWHAAVTDLDCVSFKKLMQNILLGEFYVKFKF